MKSVSLLLATFAFIASAPLTQAQKVRTALIPAGGAANVSEQLTINELEHGLLEDGQIELVDHRLIQQTLKQQLFNNSNLTDPATSTKFGAILGVPMLVYVRFDGFRSDMKSTPKFGGLSWTGNVFFQMTALVIDVQTGAILAAPTAKSDKTNEVLAAPKFGKPPVLPPGPTDALEEMNKRAFRSVISELTPQLILALRKSAPAATAKVLQVAGVRGNITFLNGGTSDSVKVGDRYQIFRMSDNGLINPASGKPILERTDVCILAIKTVQQPDLSSGECLGAVARPKDQATAIPQP